MFHRLKIIYGNIETELTHVEAAFLELSAQTLNHTRSLKAAAEGDLDKLKALLEYRNTNVDAKRNRTLNVAETTCNLNEDKLETHEPSYNSTPLHFACLNGHLNVAELLLEKGANIEAADDYNTTALHLASGSGHTHIVVFLINSGANCNARTRRGVTPLHFAAEQGHLEVLQHLISNGAYFNARTHSFLFEERETKNSQFFRSVRVPALSVENWTPLICSIKKNSLSVMKILLQIAVSVESDFIDSLAFAGVETFCIAVEFLISVDNHVKEVGLHNFQQLFKLVMRRGCELKRRRIEVFELLIKMGVDINFKYRNGKTALHFAIENEQIEMVKILLKNNADVNSLDDNQCTPLYYTLIPKVVCGAPQLPTLDSSYTDILLEHGCSRTTTLACLNSLPNSFRTICLKHVILYHVLFYPEEKKPISLSRKFREMVGFARDIDLSEYWDGCLLEIEQMKKNLMGKFSVYTICVERNLNMLSSYAQNESLQSHCETRAYWTNWPIYRDLIIKAYQRGKKRGELISKLDKLQICSKAQGKTEKVISLNRECWLNIAQYLSDIDLLSLLKSSICEFCRLSIN